MDFFYRFPFFQFSGLRLIWPTKIGRICLAYITFANAQDTVFEMKSLDLLVWMTGYRNKKQNACSEPPRFSGDRRCPSFAPFEHDARQHKNLAISFCIRLLSRPVRGPFNNQNGARKAASPPPSAPTPCIPPENPYKPLIQRSGLQAGG